MAAPCASVAIASCSGSCRVQAGVYIPQRVVLQRGCDALLRCYRGGAFAKSPRLLMCSAGATKSAYLGDRLVLRSLRLSLAPEAILVGVVALVVFGPRGLAEAVKALGNTLRTFQPTIRELASVSSELRNTLEEQIGLDEIRKEIRSATLPPLQTKPVFTDMPKSGQPPSAPTGTADETEGSLQGMKEQFVKDSDPDIERKRAEAAAMAWGNSSEKPSGLSIPTASQAEQLQSAPPTKQLSMMTIEELEAELARRKGTSDKARNM